MVNFESQTAGELSSGSLVDPSDRSAHGLSVHSISQCTEEQKMCNDRVYQTCMETKHYFPSCTLPSLVLELRRKHKKSGASSQHVTFIARLLHVPAYPNTSQLVSVLSMLNNRRRRTPNMHYRAEKHHGDQKYASVCFPLRTASKQFFSESSVIQAPIPIFFIVVFSGAQILFEY